MSDSLSMTDIIKLRYSQFQVLAALLFNISCAAYLIAMICVGDWFIGAILGGIIYLFWQIGCTVLGANTLGWISSLAFTALNIFITITWVHSSLDNRAVGNWLKQHQEIGWHDLTPRSWDGSNSIRTELTASDFRHKLEHDWLADDNYLPLAEKGIDTDKAFRAAYSNFEQWIKDGASEQAPIPTPEFMNRFCSEHQGEFQKPSDY